jgi:hypothetical protein
MVCYGDRIDAVIFPFIVKISDRVPHLEYYAHSGYGSHHWKLVGKEWVICTEEEFLSSNP